MPREVKNRLKGQKQVYAQETFDFTVPQRHGAARPVDPYEQQFESAGAKNLIDFANNVKSTGRNVMQANELYKDKKREEGATAAMKGEVATGDEHYAFLEGYEGFKGETQVGDYHKEIDALFAKAGQLDPDEWNAEKSKITQKYINGSTDAFINSFVPKAARLEEQYDVKYHQVLNKRIENDYLAGVRKIADSELTRIFNDKEIEDKDQAVRDSLSAQQDRAKSLSMADRNKISEQFIADYINKAKEQGRPDFLGFTLKPDKDGIILATHPDFADEIATGISEAINAREALDKEKRLAYERAEKKFASEAGKAILDYIDADQPNGALAILEKTKGSMSYDMYKGLHTVFKNIRAGSNTFFASTTDRTMFDLYRLKARYGSLDINKDLPEARKVLTKEDYKAVFADYVHNLDEQARDAKSGSTRKSPVEVTLDKIRSAGMSVVAQKDKVGMLMSPQAANRRALSYQIHFGNLMKEMGAAAGGVSKLSQQEQTYLADKAIYLSFIDVEPVGREKMPKNPDAPTDKAEEETHNKRITQSTLFNELDEIE